MTDERTPYVDTKVPKRLVPLVRQSLRLILESDEQMFGLFAVVRIRRSISLLVVTDRRLLTLGDEHVSLPLVDEVRRADVREVTIERTKVWTTGLVTARTIHGEEVNLGVLNVVDSSTFLRLEEVLARPTGPSTMPTIPTPGVEVGRNREREDLDDGPASTGHASTGHASTGHASVAHPLVVHLSALADLHDRGALTAEEFTTAKARLLADPGASTSS